MIFNKWAKVKGFGSVAAGVAGRQWSRTGGIRDQISGRMVQAGQMGRSATQKVARNVEAINKTGFVGKAMSVGLIAAPALYIGHDIVNARDKTPGGLAEAGLASTAEYFGSDILIELGAKPMARAGIQRFAASSVAKGMLGNTTATKLGGWAARTPALAANPVAVGIAIAAVGAYGYKKFGDHLVNKERKGRRFNWGQDTQAFNTKRAHTMRQQSMALMNRGAMSSRSLLGQEAVYVHR